MFHMIFLPDAVPPNMIEKLLEAGGFSRIELSNKQYEQFNYEMTFFLDEHKRYEEGTDDSIIKNAFERILLLFLRDAKKANATHNDPVLQDILSFLHKNFRNKITLKDIAAVANMSPSYFCAYFSQKMNLTFVEYLNSLRVNFAASMLLMPNSTVKKVALDCGFSSASYFSEVFLKTYGMTPTEFKAKNKGII
ncbi:MAG: helix-turn-helix transcriptional regulator [Ruminococcaceae bacterium]|nr:helix-turn-helix transcriptional regulator [Oscillospiraceae bacterium]